MSLGDSASYQGITKSQKAHLVNGDSASYQGITKLVWIPEKETGEAFNGGGEGFQVLEGLEITICHGLSAAGPSHMADGNPQP